jgi:hypothetical protein
MVRRAWPARLVRSPCNVSPVFHAQNGYCLLPVVDVVNYPVIPYANPEAAPWPFQFGMSARPRLG